jgi:hypothetical protein
MANDIIEVPPETPPVPAPIDKPKSQTAAESRATAVSALTQAAILRAGTLELTPEESDKLQADFGDEDFQSGAGGKENLIYIEHAALRDRLNTVLGLGQWAIIVRDTWNDPFKQRTRDGRMVDAVRVFCRAMLIVRGVYVAEAVGDMTYMTHNDSTNFGDAFEGAKTAAFRRCAKEFGIGLQAWRKEWCKGWWERRKHPAGRRVDETSGEIREYVAGIVPDGKHAGTPWTEIDDKLLRFLAEKATNVSQAVRDGAKKELERRDQEKAAAEQRAHGPDREDTIDHLPSEPSF